MTVQVKLTGAASAGSSWELLDWQIVEKQVRRLQMRIAKATREGKHGKARALQWLLTHSHYAKLLAIKRVSQNKGSKTPGIDGVVWNTAKKKMAAVTQLKRRGYKPQALRRVYIPKKKGRRPLGIPCMIDRGQQALHLLGLEPISETVLDRNTYGFRPKRSSADAIGQCFNALSRQNCAQWILEGDIKACFDKIGHDWLVKNVPMDKQVLRKWLTAGYMDKGVFYNTEEGTPQGGIISPTLMLLTLNGLEIAAKQSVCIKSSKVNTVVYADDFIITGTSKELLENKIKPAIKAFLSERGLQLSDEKTKISHIQDGFDFLGFNVRKYNGVLLIKPAKQNVLGFLNNIRAVIKKHGTVRTSNLIEILNPKIRGWGNYYRHVVSRKTYSYVDHQIFLSIFKWCIRRHPNKGRFWVTNKYFKTIDGRQWVLQGQEKQGNGNTKVHQLEFMTSISIQRHVKVKGDANPYDPTYADYFNRRRNRKDRNTWDESPMPA